MSGDRYLFDQTKLASLKKALDSNPDSIEAANRYWEALGSFGGKDVRRGGAVEVSRLLCRDRFADS